jgi:hypothetical protein
MTQFSKKTISYYDHTDTQDDPCIGIQLLVDNNLFWESDLYDFRDDDVGVEELRQELRDVFPQFGVSTDGIEHFNSSNPYFWTLDCES